MLATTYTAIATITAATIAGAISFIVTVLSKEQKTSEFRQTWIDGVRDDISEFISGIDVVSAFLAAKHLENNNANKLDLLISQSETLREISTRYHRLQLRLNPKEHQDLLTALAAVYSSLSDLSQVGDREKIGELIQTVISPAQKNLKNEWQRVKRGEPSFYITKSISLGVVIFAISAVLYVIYS